MRVTHFQENLKQSKREAFSQLPHLLDAKVAIVSQKFAHTQLYRACIDESIANRTEFSLDTPSNRSLAYLGDAFLSYRLALRACDKRMTPDAFQTWRTSHTSDKHLAGVYDTLFGSEDVVLHFNDTLSVKQKATFIEALIGLIQTDEMVDMVLN